MRSRKASREKRSKMATMPSAPKKTRSVTAQWTSQAPETRGSASPPVKSEMPALLKALMERKALLNSRSPVVSNSPPGQSRNKAMAPRASMPMLQRMTRPKVPRLPRMLPRLTKSSITSCCRTPTPNRASRASKEPKAMMFSPPSLIRTIRTTWPLCVKKVSASSIISPVTQVALVEVKRASKKGMPPEFTVISGSMSRPVPARMRKRKLLMNRVAGWKRNRGRVRARSESSMRTTTRK